MFEHIKLQSLDDFFLGLDKRSSKGIFFYRVNGYNSHICEFVKKYYDAARVSGVIIENKIPNPDEKNLAYYNEMMGMDFQLSMGFLTSGLKKWLPRMNEYQRNTVAGSIYDTLDMLRKSGKNDNMLKNTYIKFMCWLYYKFEQIVGRLGDNNVPKILYQGDISNYELLLIKVLADAGCDVVLLQYAGDDNYLKLDADSSISDNLNMANMEKFPEEFNIKWLRTELQKDYNKERLYGRKPEILNCTNAWIEGKGLKDFKKPVESRGNDPKLFYNCYYRINGVEDKLSYLNDLYHFQMEIKNSNRKLVIIDNEIPQPTTEEINAIRRKNYTSQDDMIMDISSNMNYISNVDLQRLMVKNFVDILLEEAKEEGSNLSRLTNKAVILLCMIKRYHDKLLGNWKKTDIGTLIFLGGCKNKNELMYIKFIARLPVDVLILVPNLSTKCMLEDTLLYELNYSDSLDVNKIPQENGDIHIGTAAYHAERELDTIMYGDSGMYRNHQYSKAVSVTLQTMYEEIEILWQQELKYRPSFSTDNGMVNMPVIFAKISGVKNGDLSKYWSSIKTLLTPDTYAIGSVPFIKPTDPNPIKSHAAEFFKNGKLQKEKIKAHPSYQYGMLREDIQEHIFSKLQILIDQKLIKGTFENGTEYTIIATVLNMRKEFVRMLQRFDFTKVNPKLVCVITSESIMSLEDTILLTFLNLVGFDIAIFVPTGYQSVERYFNKRLMEEHQTGEYLYDLRLPDFSGIPSNGRSSWRDKIFKRGI